jgi:copper homeostasis protein
MKTLCFELCVESLEAAQAADAGGADRIELCAKLSVGGVSPSFDLVKATVKAVSIPVHVLIRPRDGDFNFSSAEFDLMKRQIEEARKSGAAGVAIGVLLSDGRVDVDRSRALVELAWPMKSTFHRAFDETPDLAEALEDVIATGADCLLTSGGAQDVLSGADSIARLREQAGERLDVMAGGGLRLHNLSEVARRAGVSFLHGSMTRGSADSHSGNSTNGVAAALNPAVLEADVREAVRLLRNELATSGA